MDAFYIFIFLVFCTKDILGQTAHTKMIHNQGSCPKSYSSIGENCYHFGSEKVSGDAAFAKCLEKGGYLANFETLEEALVMKYHLNEMNTGLHYYVGGRNINRYVSGGDWRWIKQGTMTKMAYYAFDNGEPNGSNAAPQDCMFFYRTKNTYNFHSVFCDNPTYFGGYICETDSRKLVL